MTAPESTPPRVEGADDVLSQAGEVWKWMWLWAHIVSVGPKQVTFQTETRTGWETRREPLDRVMGRFHKTGLGR